MKLTNAHAECTYEVCTGGMGVYVKFINFYIAWHWRDGCKYDAVLTQCAYLGVHMKLIWMNGCTYAVAIAIFATQMWNSSISTFNKTGLKGHLHLPCRRYHKGPVRCFPAGRGG